MRTINVILAILSLIVMVDLLTFAFNHEGFLCWLAQRVLIFVFLSLTAAGLYFMWKSITEELTNKDNG